MRNTILIISLLFLTIAYSLHAQNSEKQWLIDHYFSSQKELNTALSSINSYIVFGKYQDAKAIINKLKQQQLKSEERAAVLCYEATICYNESKYEKAIQLSDSSLQLLQKQTENRYRIKSLNTKAKALGALNNYVVAEHLLDSTIVLARTINDKYGLGASWYLLGSFYSDKGQYTKSNELNQKSIIIRKEIGDQNGLAACYSFMGLNYAHMSNYAEGIEYIQNSITIREKTGDKRGLANSYLNLYKIYIEIGESDKAMDSEFKSLEICREINDLQCVSGRLTNIGQIYQNKGEYKKALDYHFMALNISRQLNIRNRVALVHENMARVYNYTGNYSDAIKHIDSSMVLRQLIDDAEGLASAQLVLSTIQYKQHQYHDAIQTASAALKAAEQLKLPYLIKEAHQMLSNLYQQQHNPEKAFYHYKHFISLRDSIYNIDKTKEIVRKELEFNFEKTQALQRSEQAKKEELAQQENNKQKNIILLSSFALIILSCFLGFAIWQYRLKNRSQKQLQLLNTHLNTSNKELNEKNKIIEVQHHTIHSKNIEITDSIRYAHKIQSAMMPLQQEFAQHFKESFVIFEPKDIISGDFFWITQRNGKTIYATGDCTGHGVPGGFMSMLGVSLLNEIINEHDLTEPALILSRLRKKVITALKQKGLAGEQQDGMDMTICVLDRQENKLQYAAANHFFYIIRQQEILEFKGDKQPVGIFGSDLKPFKQFEIDLKEGDTVYTFTDGLADQFGGPKGKKFKYKQLKELLLSVQHLPLQEQEPIIKQQFITWKGKLEQVDDVCIIGVRV